MAVKVSIGLIALVILIGGAGCGGGAQTVAPRELPDALLAAIPQLKKAGYEVHAQVIGPDRVPVLVVNPDADGAAFIAAYGGVSPSPDIPLAIDGVPADMSGNVASAAESFCGRFSAQAPNQQDAAKALHASGLCHR